MGVWLLDDIFFAYRLVCGLILYDMVFAEFAMKHVILDKWIDVGSIGESDALRRRTEVMPFF